MISGAATLEFAAASSVNVTFAGGNFGTLVLDNPTVNTGQIFGFTGTGPQNPDVIDLKGITFDAGTSWVYYDNTGSIQVVRSPSPKRSMAPLRRSTASLSRPVTTRLRTSSSRAMATAAR